MAGEAGKPDWTLLKRQVLLDVATSWRELRDEVEDGERAEVRLPDLMRMAREHGVVIVPRVSTDGGEADVIGLTYVVERDGGRFAVFSSHAGLTWPQIKEMDVRFDDGDLDGVADALADAGMDDAEFRGLPRPDGKPDREFIERVAEPFVKRVKEFGWIEILQRRPSGDPAAVDIGFTLLSPIGTHTFKERGNEGFNGFDHANGYRKARELERGGVQGPLSSIDVRIPALATKIFYDDGAGTKVVPNAEKRFHEAVEVATRGTLADVHKIMRSLDPLQRWHVCRGGLADGGKRPRQEGWYRRHRSDDPGTNDIAEKPRSLVILDIDKMPTVDGTRFLENPEKAIRDYLDAYGPEEIKGVAFVPQLSSSCGVVKRDADGAVVSDGSERINAHVTVLLDRPVPDAVLSGWLMAANAKALLEHGIRDAFDVRALVTSQPIYTARPQLVNVESVLDDFGVSRVGKPGGGVPLVPAAGITAEAVSARLLELDRLLHAAGIEPPKGFKSAVSNAFVSMHGGTQGQDGPMPPRTVVASPAVGSWKGGGVSTEDFEKRLKAGLSMQPGGMYGPLTAEVGRHIAMSRGDVDMDGMKRAIMSAMIHACGTAEIAAQRTQHFSSSAQESLISTYLNNYRAEQADRPQIKDDANALVESPALGDDPDEALWALRGHMRTLGNPAEVDVSGGTGRRWRLERELAERLCTEFSVRAAAEALVEAAGIPPREAYVTCVKSVLEPSLTRDQWERKVELEREGRDTSHIRPYPSVQKARLERLAAWLLDQVGQPDALRGKRLAGPDGSVGYVLHRAGAGVVGVEWGGRTLRLSTPERWANGSWNSVAKTQGAGTPLVVRPTTPAVDAGGLWGSGPCSGDCTVRIFSRPSEAAEWIQSAGFPADVKAISYGGFTDRVSREGLASVAADLVDRGARGVVVEAGGMDAQDIAEAIADRGVRVAAPHVAGFPKTLEEPAPEAVRPEAEPELPPPPPLIEPDEYEVLFTDFNASIESDRKYGRPNPKFKQ